ncbi:MAG: helix-hairpin-helix domain-containing protein [Lewinellaceae bacterium]|nr:helix-hairpin-helix domain-containing protein [Lewinellaceae bacterium]
MKSFLQDYFYYSRAERNGAFVLALICTGLFLFPRVYPHFIKEWPEASEQYREEALAFFETLRAAEDPVAREEGELFYFDPNTISEDSLRLLGLSPKTAATIIKYREKVRQFYRAEDLQKIYTLKEEDYRRLAPYIRLAPPPPAARQVKMEREKPPAAELQPFPFDPNTAGEEELKRLGLPPRVVRNMLKYREKGGRFREPEALQKVYGMEEETFLALAPFVEIGEEENPEDPEKQPEKAPSGEELAPASNPVPAPVTIDINQATAEEWRQLKGIGPGYAGRIVRFRDKLGGFAGIDQVAETYGLPDSTFQHIRPYLKLSPVFRRININTAGAETLKAHPYLGWRQANAIVNYRAQHGPFKGIEDMRKLRALPAEVVERIGPYLEF